MKQNALATIILIGWITSVTLTGQSLAYSFGPPDESTSAPGEQSCAQCHSSTLGDGGITLLNVPATYSPGTDYQITVSLQDPEQSRWGFELTAIDANQQGAGTFTVTDIESTQLSDNGGTQRDYLKQTLPGTFLNVPDGPVTWSFRWTAPQTNVGTVTFYAAGNAANADFSPGGDYIYLVNAPVLAPTTPTPTPVLTATPTATPLQATPTPASTVGPCSETGVTLSMPAMHYQQGDRCDLIALVCNATSAAFVDEKLFIFLEAYGYFYFAPSWGQDLDYYGDQRDFPPGETVMQIIDEFSWPTGVGLGAARFWGALTDPDITTVKGVIGNWDFSWAD